MRKRTVLLFTNRHAFIRLKHGFALYLFRGCGRYFFRGSTTLGRTMCGDPAVACPPVSLEGLSSDEYKDEKGRSFIFTESGTAKWPGKKFRYEVMLDYVGSTASCDLLMK